MQTSKNYKKIFAAVSVGIIILVASSVAAYYFELGPFNSRTNESVNLEPAKEEEKSTGSDTKQSTLEQNNAGKHNTGSDPSPAPQPVEGSNKKSVGMEISAANQTDTSLQVRTYIQTVTDTGVCSLSIKNANGVTYTATADVQALASTTTCKGFDIPVEKLSPGRWTVVINFSNDNLIASATKVVVIK